MANKNRTLKRVRVRFAWKEQYSGLVFVAIVAAVVGLLIFNFVSRKPTPTVEAPQGAEQQTKPVEGKEAEVKLPTVHTVTKGESLTRLSLKFYQKADLWPSIAKENNLTNPSIINPGDKLNIPAAQDAAKVKFSDIIKKSTEPVTGTTYQVNLGDTLWDIAVRAYGTGFDWVKIDQANNLGRLPNGVPLIHSGNVLVIPR